MDRRVEGLVARLGSDGDTLDGRTLVALALELGATDDEILRAGRDGLAALTLDLVIRRPGEAQSLDELAVTSGLDPRLVQRVWLAFGLPAPAGVPLLVTADLADAIRTLASLAVTLGEDPVLGVARVIGASGAQLAAAIANTSRVGIEVPQRDSGVPYADVIVHLTGMARDLLPPLWDAVGAVFRRHLVAVSSQAWAPDVARSAVTVTTTVGFVDLAGSTDVLRTLSVAEVAAAVNRFEQLVGDLVTRAGGRVVKLIGDEAMFVIEDPAGACRLGLALVAASPQPVRVGLARGEVVALYGDFYGPTVNLAARLVAAAPTSTVLVDGSLAEAAAGEVTLEPIDTGPLRGFPDVSTAWRVVDAP